MQSFETIQINNLKKVVTDTLFNIEVQRLHNTIIDQDHIVMEDRIDKLIMQNRILLAALFNMQDRCALQEQQISDLVDRTDELYEENDTLNSQILYWQDKHTEALDNINIIQKEYTDILNKLKEDHKKDIDNVKQQYEKEYQYARLYDHFEFTEKYPRPIYYQDNTSDINLFLKDTYKNIFSKERSDSEVYLAQDILKEIYGSKVWIRLVTNTINTLCDTNLIIPYCPERTHPYTTWYYGFNPQALADLQEYVKEHNLTF